MGVNAQETEEMAVMENPAAKQSSARYHFIRWQVVGSPGNETENTTGQKMKPQSSSQHRID